MSTIKLYANKGNKNFIVIKNDRILEFQGTPILSCPDLEISEIWGNTCLVRYDPDRYYIFRFKKPEKNLDFFDKNYWHPAIEQFCKLAKAKQNGLSREQIKSAIKCFFPYQAEKFEKKIA